jgi:hypothetical protein
MHYYRLQLICLIVMSVIGSARAQNTNTNHFQMVQILHANTVVPWNPNTRLLDLPAQRQRSFEQDRILAIDVENFYLALRDKKWPETYKGRARAFQEDFPATEYLAEAINSGKRWGLANYEVLSATLMNSGPTNDMDVAILICKFTELPLYTDSYSTVYWHREDGHWKCLSAGPHGLGIFGATRPPIIDWR